MQLSYDDLIQNKLLAFTVFSKVKTPQSLIEVNLCQRIQQQDWEAFQLSYRDHAIRINNYFRTSILGSFLFCLALKIRNPIFALTSKPTYFGITKKYILIPYLICTPFQVESRKNYQDQVNKIINKYDFSSPEFHQAFQQIEEQGGLRKFLKNNLNDLTEIVSEKQQESNNKQ